MDIRPLAQKLVCMTLVCEFLLGALFPRGAFAGEIPVQSYEKEEKLIPKAPSAPPSLEQRIPPNLPHCERYFTYGGKRLECDSQLGRDAEMLRPIMRDVPDAIAELDAYARANNQILVAGYVASAGFLTAIIGGAAASPLLDPGTGALRTGGYLVFGGLALAANAIIYGLSLLKTNEAHIGNAVRIYNDVHPDKPIVLEFTTSINF